MRISAGFLVFAVAFSLGYSGLGIGKGPALAASSSEVEAEAPAAEEEAAAEGGDHGGGAAAGYGFDFVELDPLYVPIIDENGVTQTVSLVVSVEVKKVSYAEKVRTLQPRLKDAFIQEMYGVMNRHAALEDGVIKVKMIKERLTKVSAKVLGDDVVNDILLQVVQQRQI